ncbi:MAG: serine/threonine protein kinase [Myxococcaceae bacterium]|nr:serine/threonine protein kinase [Myxococcaceae bacterium]
MLASAMVSLSDERFELLRQVGEGGSDVVYEARDRTSDRCVAVKLLQEIGRVADGRFECEAALLADIQHPSVVRYVAHGERRGSPRHQAGESTHSRACATIACKRATRSPTRSTSTVCLLASERRGEARLVLAGAKAWLSERAGKAEHTGLRLCFLNGVPENVRLAALEL